VRQNWNGDDSGCAAALGSMEASWAAVGARLAAQQEASLLAEAAAVRVAAAAAARRDAWRPLEAELARLPEVEAMLVEAWVVAQRCANNLDVLAAALDAADAAAATAPLAARAAAAAREAAAAEGAHERALEDARAARQRELSAAAAAATAAAAAAAARAAPPPHGHHHGQHHGAPAQSRRLRVSVSGGDASSRTLAAVEGDLSEATASLRRFLEGGDGGGDDAGGGGGVQHAPADDDEDTRRTRCGARDAMLLLCFAPADASALALAPRRRHKERGPDGERRRRHRREVKGLEYLDYKGAPLLPFPYQTVGERLTTNAMR
jgi:tetratricopeptide (TPR) repeat protein